MAKKEFHLPCPSPKSKISRKRTLPGYGKKTLPPSSPLFSVEDEAVSFKYSEKRLLVGTPVLSEWSGTRFVQGFVQGFVHGNQWYGIPWLTV